MRYVVLSTFEIGRRERERETEKSNKASRALSILNCPSFVSAKVVSLDQTKGVGESQRADRESERELRRVRKVEREREREAKEMEGRILLCLHR